MDGKVCFLISSKGKEVAVFNNFEYRFRRKSENVRVFRCLYDRSQKCTGSLYVNCSNEVTKNTTQHNCIPNTAKTEVKVKIANCRKRCLEEFSSPVASIFRDEFQELYNKGLDLVTEIPQYSSAKTAMCRARRVALGTAQDPMNRESINSPAVTFQMADGSSFLKLSDGIENKLLVFGSTKGVEALENLQDFFMDGTFHSCSKQFTQIYTIHADCGSTDLVTNVLPVLYILLPDKCKKTYNRLFTLLKSLFPKWSPRSITVDFELGVLKSLEENFPNAQILGCNYHFNQCLWRKVQQLGLVKDYAEKEDVKLHVRMCAALAYLPLHNIDEGWLLIMENSPSDSKVAEFNDYFVDQWLENKYLHRSVWNCFSRRHRTNNVLEGWNSRLNSVIQRRKPNFHVLVQRLKDDAEHTMHLFNRTDLGMMPNKRRKRYVQIDSRICKILCNFNQSGDLGKCLRSLGNVQKLQ